MSPKYIVLVSIPKDTRTLCSVIIGVLAVFSVMYFVSSFNFHRSPMSRWMWVP